MTAPQSSLNGPRWDETQLVAAEYANLRAEIVKLTELQFQATAATVVAFGTVLSIGIQVRNAAIILVHPILSFVLGIIWLHYANLIARIATYLREIEDRVGHHNLSWEHYVQAHPLPRGRFAYWGIRPVFIVTSILAVVASLPVATPSITVILFYVLAIMVTGATVTTFIIWHEPAPELNGSRI
ncbi:MAG: hypothetical protein JWQ32_3581 [Marmoricola sp.]|jgi:hypothetical protein|nr:hypothetical protein [Marmoricola sp.]